MSSLKTAPILPTVSRAFLEDWLAALRGYCSHEQVDGFLTQTGLSPISHPRARVTHDQIVRLYKLVVVETGDEMMGLWSRPIRAGALKHLCASTRGASSLSAVLYRFSSFWNLLLDDHHMTFEAQNGALRLSLISNKQTTPQYFGHVLLLKLAHGVASWLVGREIPLKDVSFEFDRPSFAEDYPILFPAPIRFSRPNSSISFDDALSDLPVSRTETETQEFLARAPRDWIFTSLREHTLSLRVREILLLSDQLDCGLGTAAKALNLTPRTLMRRLGAEDTSFQQIKDGLRRDIAIRDISHSAKTIEAISQDLGFASAATFHRAFRRWTDATPSTYR